MTDISPDLPQKIDQLTVTVDTNHTILVYTWVVSVAIFGGMISYLSKVARGAAVFSLFKFVVELGCAAFLGLLTASFASSQNISWEMSGGLAGVAAHMGSRALFLLDFIVMRKIEKLTGETLPKEIMKRGDSSDEI